MRYRVNSPSVISETIQGETIIIHLTTGVYYSLRGTGPEVWDALAASASVREIAEELAAHADVTADQAAAAVEKLIADLLAEDLIAVDSDVTARVGAPSPNGNGAGGPRRFEAPELGKYTDMQDLVLLDPVHEVTDAGWPEAKPQVLDA
jgi:hypothetical protein